MADTISSLNLQLDGFLKPLFENKIFLACLGLFLAVYAGWLAPALPDSVVNFFDTSIGKLIFIFLIAFVASRNVPNSFQVALIVSVIFLITLTVLNNLKMKEAFRNVSMEHFGLMEQMNELLEHADKQKPDEPPSPGANANAGAPGANAGAPGAGAGAGADNVPKPLSCEDVLNKCYSKFDSEQQKQVCGGLFEEPAGAAVPLPVEADFAQNNCGGYIKQCMSEPSRVSTKKYLNMKSSSCAL
jgi:hypothetical protein